jgi:hypothetical protein
MKIQTMKPHRTIAGLYEALTSGGVATYAQIPMVGTIMLIRYTSTAAIMVISG